MEEPPMNGAIAAQIAVAAMREQFNYHNDGRTETDPKRTARSSGLARMLRSLAARVGRRSQRSAGEAWGTR
jgi:hypothetical protein